MKKLTATLLTALLAVVMQAQIVITSDNIAPIGTTIVTANDTTPDATIVPGNAGENQTWDFSALHEHFYDTIYTVSPASTPNPDLFPDANYAIQNISDNDTMYGYMIKNSDYMSLLGFTGNFTDTGDLIVITIVPEEVIFDFPMQYGNHRDESFYYEIVVAGGGSGIDSIKYKQTTEKSIDVDAWGTITTPSGTFDALRRKTVSNITDSTWILFFGTWTLISNDTSSTTSYDWHSNQIDPGYTLMSMDIEEGQVTNVDFLIGSYVGIKESVTQKLKIYPNPAKNSAFFETAEFIKGKMTVYTVSGNKIFEKEVTGKKFKIDVSQLKPGNYFVTVTGNSDKRLHYSGKLTVK